MFYYILKRFLWLFPTLFGVLLINFALINLTPGGPIDVIKSQMVSQEPSDFPVPDTQDRYANYSALDDETIDKLKKEFGFDQPIHLRFVNLVWDYIRFDFGDSYYKDQKVSKMLLKGLPVSLTITIFSLLLILLIAIPLGMQKAIKKGTAFDLLTTIMIAISFAIPGFVFALWLLIFFAGGSFLNWFPIRGLFSEEFENFTIFKKIIDFLWHLILPIFSIVLGGFAKTTILSKNSFLSEISKLYVTVARAKGCSKNYVLWHHCFRNAMLIVFSNIPHAFLNIFFYATLLIEYLFSLEGIGFIGYEAIVTRDYPVMFATFYLFTLTGMIFHIVGDIISTYMDPRINLSDKRK